MTQTIHTLSLLPAARLTILNHTRRIRQRQHHHRLSACSPASLLHCTCLSSTSLGIGGHTGSERLAVEWSLPHFGPVAITSCCYLPLDPQSVRSHRGSDDLALSSDVSLGAQTGHGDCDNMNGPGTIATGLCFLACALFCPQVSLAEAETGFPTVMTFAGAEPSNALSLPTWIIHVASVVEWVTAMALVWEYGSKSGNSAWKGLSWGMVPLLGGAMCACTWHFFYNAESLEVLVVLQSSLTVVGNFTMWAAAYRIWKLSREKVTLK